MKILPIFTCRSAVQAFNRRWMLNNLNLGWLHKGACPPNSDAINYAICYLNVSPSQFSGARSGPSPCWAGTCRTSVQTCPDATCAWENLGKLGRRWMSHWPQQTSTKLRSHLGLSRRETKTVGAMRWSSFSLHYCCKMSRMDCAYLCLCLVIL